MNEDTPLPEDILAHLRTQARERSDSLDRAIATVRGLWRTGYILKLSPEDVDFHLSYLRVQTVGHGCCYFEPDVEDVGLRDLVGRNVFDLDDLNRVVQVAALDAVYSSLREDSSERHIIKGHNFEKGPARAKILCAEAIRLADSCEVRARKVRLVCVGVVGGVIAELARLDRFEMHATDYFKKLAGREVHGVKVDFGDKTGDQVRHADVAIVTGMTLGNETLEPILNVARENRTKVVIFAETGANFAAEYCRLGVDTVVSEPFPFYLTGDGESIVDVYRREDFT